MTEARVWIGWSPDDEETLIDRLGDPSKTLTRRGQAQFVVWGISVGLLIYLLLDGGRSGWVRAAGLILVALIGLGICNALLGLWTSAVVLRRRGRLLLPDRALRFVGWPEHGNPTTLVAVLMVLVAALAAVVYFAYGWLSAWAPGIVLGALTLAGTVTVVDGALRAGERRRLEERRRPAVRQIHRLLYTYVLTEANQYAVWDPYAFPNSPVASFEGWMDLLVDVADSTDPTKTFVEHQRRVGQQIGNAKTLFDQLDRIRIRNGDVLTDALNEAIDELGPELEESKVLHFAAGANVEEPSEALARAASMTLRAVRDVVDATNDGIPPEFVDELVDDIWAKSSAYAAQRRAALEI